MSRVFLTKKPEYPITTGFFEVFPVCLCSEPQAAQKSPHYRALTVTGKIPAKTPFRYRPRPNNLSVTKGIRPSTGEKISCVAALFLRGSFIPIIPE